MAIQSMVMRQENLRAPSALRSSLRTSPSLKVSGVPASTSCWPTSIETIGTSARFLLNFPALLHSTKVTVPENLVASVTQPKK